ncbi:spore germination protein [Neobacillus thermocopriae]|uniref:Spore germination protein n=1 Tax=Neobacillus thermocopriae TaxID=1215031 RepID=A0A6B3TUE3_9BACI|nr:spore germination protein [Neobacillus thermocopriae]MED3624910.1 spore germination protein [Neobacillus thermocopriae]MED3713911.1 spore germination protein [Neobacillus thermocopriae]NEX79909.1 spore germination protein [Neobacillus thermocopriae]
MPVQTWPIPESVNEIENYMKQRVGLGISFDLGVRKLKILKHDVHIYYINGLCDTEYIIQLIKELVAINNREKLSVNLFHIIENRLVNQSVERIQQMDQLVDKVLSGLIVVVINGESTALAIDVRSYPGRAPQEPDTEKVVRGSRDGFVENIILNTALTRRRIRDERLRFEMLKVGKRSKADVALGYLEDVADPNLVNIIRKELQAINIDGIPMADKTIEEFVVKQGLNPFPIVRYTERADVAAMHILEGHVVIYCDTSPSVIITPTTYFHHVQHAEEFRESPAMGTFVRWTRFLGVFVSIFLLPFWLLMVLEPSLLPEQFKFIGPNDKTNIPIIVQLFIADFGLEFLRLAAIHTPTPLTAAMGLIAAVLIGQIAIDVGLFVPEVILYVAVAGIGSFTTPSYELSVANKIAKMLVMILTAAFHGPGFVIGCTLLFIFLINMRALNTPYLWPFLPFEPKGFMQILFRRAIPGSILRPSIVHPRDRYRQAPNNQ